MSNQGKKEVSAEKKKILGAGEKHLRERIGGKELVGGGSIFTKMGGTWV